MKVNKVDKNYIKIQYNHIFTQYCIFKDQYPSVVRTNSGLLNSLCELTKISKRKQRKKHL